ncbi:MAG TPA: DUF58 domain-containing protein [Cyanobacteria bacterium UBA11370]|nr:DUF58 domain-containing protein [Cyanobacteria bacterium UBA11370]HBY78231.1 DUF58 domain-containing protein [Cyanobacteria bacterium UBA11148]
MEIINRTTDWLETHWVTPAYAGWLLAGVAICFFAAATNTMAGWLYVISGIIFALLGLAVVLPVRSLRNLSVRRHPLSPVTVGDQLSIELEIENHSLQPKTLLQVQDILQSELGEPVYVSIETIEPQSTHHWVYFHPTQKRGVYRWYEVQLRTGTPLGLFWCRRSWQAPAMAIIYPTVLPLTQCPLVDEMGHKDSPQIYSDRRSQSATEDLTKALRPYRVGDPTRLIHWRSSARYGELLVRELEVFTGSQDIIICLDSGASWNFDDFESAVIAAASMYFYACSRQVNAKLWTAKTGLLHGNQVVLEALAATYAGEDADGGDPPYLPSIWLTQNPARLNSLPPNSRWVLWSSLTLKNDLTQAVNSSHSGIIIDNTQPLDRQLQQPIQK